MDVSVVCPDLSHNCLGRAHLLGSLIERNFSVEIIGPQMGASIWEPVEDEFEYVSIESSNRATSLPSLARRFLSKAEGNVLYVSKPRPTSYGVALLLKLLDDRMTILDIDDWESGLCRRSTTIRTYLYSSLQLGKLHSFYWVQAMERLSGLADAVTVSNTFLRDRFGGDIIPHVRDTDSFDPDKYNPRKARLEYGIPPEKTIVMFSGTPRPHKGVEELIKAVTSCSEDIVGVIVGVTESDYHKRLREEAGDRVMIFGQQPFEELPKWLATADIVAIPQRETSNAVGQIPAKVFDAMAMAKPIIATDVSDLSQILDGCGLVIQPGDTAALREAIQCLHDNADLRHRLGDSARERCVRKYSYDATAPKIASIVNPLLHNNR